jgi:hypothetical protein
LNGIFFGLESRIRNSAMSRRQFRIGLMLGACLLAAGCSAFSPQEKEPRPKDILTQPITRQRAERRQEEQKTNWFTSLFVPKDPPPPKSVGEWIGKTEPIRP